MYVCMLGLDIAYVCTKSDDCSLSHSRDMVGAHQNLNGSRDLTIPLLGIICHSRARNCYDQPIYQICSLYVDMTGDTKCGKLGGLG